MIGPFTLAGLLAALDRDSAASGVLLDVLRLDVPDRAVLVLPLSLRKQLLIEVGEGGAVPWPNVPWSVRGVTVWAHRQAGVWALHDTAPGVTSWVTS